MNELITDKQTFLTLVKAWCKYAKSLLPETQLIGYIKTEYGYYSVNMVKDYGITCNNLITTNGESITFWNSLNRPGYQIFIFDIPIN